VKIQIYVEGGGSKKKDLKIRCRRGFRKFLEKSGDFVNHMPSIIACGDRGSAYTQFCNRLRSGNSEEFPILLVDSEGAVSAINPWDYLFNRDKWKRPHNAQDEQAHLMVQCMEAWFLADIDTLENYFGCGFNRKNRSGLQNIEEVEKTDVFNRLKSIARQSGLGEYRKGSHSFDILKQIDPAKVCKASQHAKRLIDTLRRMARR